MSYSQAKQLEVLKAGVWWAFELLPQIQWVDIDDRQPGDDRFRTEASEFVRRPKNLDVLKRLVDNLAAAWAGQAMLLRMMRPHDLEVACALITSAVKGLLVAQGRDHAWLKHHRLVVKFESIDQEWIQDAVAPAKLVN